MKTLVDKVIELQKRPQLTLGRATLINLIKFMTGYSAALEDNEIDTSYDDEFFNQFQIYIEKSHFNEFNQGWWHLIINENDGQDDEKAFETFYKHLETFRTEFGSFSEDKYKSHERAFYQIFNGLELFHMWSRRYKEVFNQCIKEKLLLCPINPYELFWNEEQFKAIQRTVQELDTGSMYVIDLVPIRTSIVNSEYLEIAVDTSYEECCELIKPGRKVVYSGDGSWGAYFSGNHTVYNFDNIYLSGDVHALLGGSSDFIDTFKRYYPAWSEGFKNYEKELEKIQDNYTPDISWLADFKKYLDSKD